MRLVYLFLQSRHGGWTVLSIAGIALFVAGLRVLIGEMDERGNDPFTNSFDGSPVPLILLFLPLATALVIGVANHSPFGELERTVSRPMAPLRFGHLLGLLIAGAGILLALGQTWDGEPERVFLRNMAGFAGLAFLAAPLTGARLSWMLPFGYGAVAFWAGFGDSPPKWAWPMQSANNQVAMLLAIGLLLFGLAVAAIVGGRDSKDGAD